MRRRDGRKRIIESKRAVTHRGKAVSQSKFREGGNTYQILTKQRMRSPRVGDLPEERTRQRENTGSGGNQVAHHGCRERKAGITLFRAGRGRRRIHQEGDAGRPESAENGRKGQIYESIHWLMGCIESGKRNIKKKTERICEKRK